MARSASSSASTQSGSGDPSTSAGINPAELPPVPDDATVESLWAEVHRLQALVGPSEDDYVKLRLDVLGARDAAIGAELELGQARAHAAALGAEVARLQRDQVWLRQAVVRRMIEFRGLARTAPRRAVRRLVKR